MIKLKPCPMCGGRARCSSTERGAAAYAYVICNSCGLRIYGPTFSIYYHCKCPELRQRRNEVQLKWNRRTP